ncbi:histidine phosphatase family protein [Allonocardiopsis opalescens]|uniref:Histidine phosphatase superfamily protein (Branch 1) n=1 Tax=Allonocardiopsis opalescens TaxID=1144618 RepID=A0A2T0PZ91_9ACTN|nr:histidine phosphatase family protein [Allonocardiopsis opalescens]PRX96727.1 histidine phosphatase superfamily protein (branch 1) [Allonocardiopsis opalescens]
MPVDIVFGTRSISEDNERGIAAGRLPGRLSEQGRRLAAELGERRRENGVAAVLSSDLARAAETELPRFRPGARVLIVGHAPTRRALDQLIDGRPLEELVDADFGWREGREYRLG